ncbi:MAG: class I SAM-dependent methyltransferase [Candidatus Nanoarchaeia archaeon]|nr:class I SAM-dependent methyltransferase [Candidatus Nanoarchaeia archaeon]
MKAEIIDKRFYEKKWMSIGKWDKQKAPYLKKTADIEGLIALDWIKSYLSLGRILDIGCGAGRNSILFSKNGFDVYGFDFSKKAIDLAEILKIEEKCDAKFSVQSVLELKFENNFFDAIFDFGCFHHLRKNQWNKYLKNILKVLKPKGYYLIYCFSKESEETGNHKASRDYSYRNHHYNHYFDLDELKKIFSNNFKIIKSKIIKEKGRLLAFNIVLFQKI